MDLTPCQTVQTKGQAEYKCPEAIIHRMSSIIGKQHRQEVGGNYIPQKQSKSHARVITLENFVVRKC